MSELLRIGTRASKLALAQTEIVTGMLRAAHPGLAIESVHITTAGDRDQTSQLSSGEGIGWFTSALQEALLGGEIDVAVHSYKDLPTRRPEALVIAAVPAREDPHDALVGPDGTLRSLPRGAVVGTSSARRAAQLRAQRPDLDLRPIRGNVDTRIAKLDAGDYDAIVLALAGLRRLGLGDRVTHVLSFEEMLPAPAQGALAIECRTGDARARALLSALDDREVRLAVTAEREFLAMLEAGCSFPAAAHATLKGGQVTLNALLEAANGEMLRTTKTGAADLAADFGRQAAKELMARAGMG